jgi:ribosomal protein S3
MWNISYYGADGRVISAKSAVLFLATLYYIDVIKLLGGLIMDFMIRSILKDWKDDAKITHLMQYSLRDKVLTVYTDRPGPLIGRMGERVDRFKQRLLKETFGQVKEVRLEETRGIV